jgi:Raf kinase inhibitor-like YbhB/YbcL family protein
MKMRLLLTLPVLTLLLAAATLDCAAQQPPAPPPSKFKLTVTAYTEGSQIPSQYTCADPNVSSPGLQWINPPANTASYAVIFHDTDAAPAKGSMDVTHWTLWNIAGSADQLPANIKVDASPDGIVQGKNIRGNNGYQGPCPPPGATPHHYIYEIYALDQKLDLPAGASRVDLLKAMDGHVIGKATYVGLFSR